MKKLFLFIFIFAAMGCKTTTTPRMIDEIIPHEEPEIQLPHVADYWAYKTTPTNPKDWPEDECKIEI